MSIYQTVKLSEVALSIDYGLTASAVDQDGPRFLRITDLKEGDVDWSTVPSCHCSDTESKKYTLQADDIVFARTGATTGKSYLIKSPPKGAVFASYLIRVRPSKDVFPQYLAHFFNSTKYWQQIESLAEGAAQPGVNASKLGKLKIPLPPLEEQKRIAAILDKADSLRRKRAQAIALADDFLRATFLDMFGDPVTNPKGWPVRQLQQLCDVATGATPNREVEAYFGGDVPWVKTGEVDSDWITTSEEFITDRALNETNCKLFPPKTILVAMYGQGKTRGKAGMLGLSAATNQACAAILPSRKIQSEFLLSLLKFSYESIRAMGRGGNQENLNLAMIKSLEIIVPDAVAVANFIRMREKILTLIERQNVVLEEGNSFYRNFQHDVLENLRRVKVG